MNANHETQERKRPWWSYGHVWMIIAGPAIVVVAGFFTYYLAVRAPDPVLPTIPAVQSGSQATDISQAPAVQARNHAAAGEMPAQRAPKP